MQLADILALEGVVIRKIERVTVNHWLTSAAALARHKANGAEIVTNEKGRELIKETKTNSLGGKYLLTIVRGQGSLAPWAFDLKHCGVGDTIEAAYEDYKRKN